MYNTHIHMYVHIIYIYIYIYVLFIYLFIYTHLTTFVPHRLKAGDSARPAVDIPSGQDVDSIVLFRIVYSV